MESLLTSFVVFELGVVAHLLRGIGVKYTVPSPQCSG